MDNSTRTRGIQQSMFQWSQNHSQRFPGLGEREILTATGRFQVLLDGNFVSPEFLISPVEIEEKTPSRTGLTTDNISYSLLDISPGAKGRRAEWAATANSEATVVFDRNTGKGPGRSARSIHSSSDWRGSVTYNDGHTNFETTNVLERTRYGSQTNVDDDLFIDDNGDGADALGVFD
ncbi:MAG: hypothetical protein CMJ18_09195 [Phycisphaeraceae bacterium]|nr:hypothetical protein [Phycisphaeraceae bacterium]